MDINLQGKVPTAHTLKEANQVIKALWSIICQLKEKTQTNSKNSSLPPSKDKSSKNKSNIKRTARRKKNPKNPGGRGSRQGCNLTGGSPVVTITRIQSRSDATTWGGNKPGYAWCIRPSCLTRKGYGGSNQGVERIWGFEH